MDESFYATVGGIIVKRVLSKIGKAIFVVLIVIVLLAGIYFVAKTIGIKGEPSGEIWNKEKQFDQEGISRLVKKNGEDYTILLFSDIQIGVGPSRAIKALRMMDELVEQTNPDFIMTAGDNTYFAFSDFLSIPIINKMDSYGIPWSVVLGNHDSEGIADRKWVGNQYESAEHSLFKMGPDNVYGVGNYVIDIVDEDGKAVYALVMMDSNEKREYPDGKDYDYIHSDQIDWYEWVIKGIDGVPSILFFHIPLPEFDDVKNLWEAGELDTVTAFGEIREPICCPPENSGMFDKVIELDSTTHIFVGHDHINNLSVEYKGVRLTYGLKTGMTCYANDDMQGATLITIKDGTHEVVVEHVYYED